MSIDLIYLENIESNDGKMVDTKESPFKISIWKASRMMRLWIKDQEGQMSMKKLVCQIYWMALALLKYWKLLGSGLSSTDRT